MSTIKDRLSKMKITINLPRNEIPQLHCPECKENTRIALDSELEARDLEIDEYGELTGRVRLALQCSQCSTELREHTFEIDQEPFDSALVAQHTDPDAGHELTVSDHRADLTIQPADDELAYG